MKKESPMFRTLIASCCRFLKKTGIPFLIILAVLCLIIYFVDNYYSYINFADRSINSNNTIQANIAAFHAIGIVVLTFILVLIAWIQLAGLKKTAHGDFLLRIDNSFQEGAVLRATEIIYLLDRESGATCNVHASRDIRCRGCDDAVTEVMKVNLQRIYESTSPDDMQKRLNISLYLDHLETMAYFVNADFMSIDDINNIHGDIIKYHCKLFDEWISTVRILSPDAYSELLGLCKKISD